MNRLVLTRINVLLRNTIRNLPHIGAMLHQDHRFKSTPLLQIKRNDFVPLFSFVVGFDG